MDTQGVISKNRRWPEVGPDEGLASDGWDGITDTQNQGL